MKLTVVTAKLSTSANLNDSFIFIVSKKPFIMLHTHFGRTTTLFFHEKFCKGFQLFLKILTFFEKKLQVIWMRIYKVKDVTKCSWLASYSKQFAFINPFIMITFATWFYKTDVVYFYNISYYVQVIKRRCKTSMV